MPSKVLTAAAVAVGFVCPATADTRIEIRGPQPREELALTSVEKLELPPSLAVDAGIDGETTIDRAKLAIRTSGSHATATLTLALSTDLWWPRDVAIAVDVPSGARATGLAVTIGGHRTVGSALATSEAEQSYRQVVGGHKDPALLEYTESTSRHDRLTLHVFPLAKASPATVEVTIELPAMTTLDFVSPVQTIRRADVEIDGKRISSGPLSQPRTLEVPAPQGQPRDAVSAFVSEKTSLYAGEMAVPRIVFSCGYGHHVVDSPNKQVIRQTVKLAMPRLQHCYMREAQRDPTLAGGVGLHFRILPSGTIGDASVDGSLASETVKACMVDEVRSWQFHASDGGAQVNYPLELVAR